MSAKPKDGIHYHSLEYKGKKFTVILSQLKLISVKRFRRFVRKISPHQFSLIQDKLINFIKKPKRTKPPCGGFSVTLMVHLYY